MRFYTNLLIMQRNKNENLLCNYTILPDRELLVWEKWIKIRKEEIENLAKKTGRPPIDLTMNTIENIREDKERKIVLEHAQIKNEPEDIFCERLNQKCYCEPVYEIRQTKADIGRPEVIEHIGVPQAIQASEKGLTGTSQQKPCALLDAQYIQYRKKREKELQHKIKKIDPYRPDIDNLMVTGSKPLFKEPGIILPEVQVSPEYFLIEHVQNAIYALQINKSIFYKDLPGQDLAHLKKMQKEPWHEACSNWCYYFNLALNKVGRAKLLLKNLGTVSLRYCWKEIRMSISFIPKNHNQQVFFFNKNERLIYPGEEKKIYFTCVSDKVGIYSESWEINFLNSNFFERSNDKFTIKLTADVTDKLEIIKRKANKFKIAIKLSALKAMAKSFIEEIIVKATGIEHQIYPYKNLFIEAEMFEMKNPICFYHQTEVVKLKELYNEMVPGDTWDLSIASWRQAMMAMKYDDRINHYQLLRKSHSELLKPWYEGENLLEQKSKAVKIILGQLADKFNEEYKQLTIVFGSYNTSPRQSSLKLNDTFLHPARFIFYMRMFDHIGEAIETCTGILSSLDLNRWIPFDLCRK